MDDTNQLIQNFLKTCTSEQALTTAKTLIDYCPITLTDPNAAESLQLLAMRLLERLPLNSKQIAADLQLLIDLLTAQRLCKEFAPSLAKEYTLCLQQTQQIQNLEKRLQQQSQQIESQEALIRDYQAHSCDTEAMQKLQVRNAQQEQSIRRLQEEAAKTKAEITRLRAEATLPKQTSSPEADTLKTVMQKTEELEKAFHLLNQQYKNQLQRNIELREENARQRLQIKHLQESKADPEELAKIKKRVQQQEQTIRDYQNKVKHLSAP